MLDNHYSGTFQCSATFISGTLQGQFRQISHVTHKIVKIRIEMVGRHTQLPSQCNIKVYASSHGDILHKQTLKFVEPIAGSRVS